MFEFIWVLPNCFSTWCRVIMRRSRLYWQITIKSFNQNKFQSGLSNMSSSALGKNVNSQIAPVKHVLTHQKSGSGVSNNSHSHLGGGVAPPTNRAVYSLPVTSATTFAHSVLEASLDSSTASTFLKQQTSAAPGSQSQPGNTTLAGLAIISPRKAHALVQKQINLHHSNAAPLQGLQPQFSRSKLGINRSLSVLQQGPYANSHNPIYSSAGSSSNNNCQTVTKLDFPSPLGNFYLGVCFFRMQTVGGQFIRRLNVRRAPIVVARILWNTPRQTMDWILQLLNRRCLQI